MRNEIVEQHYRQNYKKLVKRAEWRVPHHSQAIAEEVVQEAYTKALKFFKAFNPEINDFGAWFNRIYNGCVADSIKSENGTLPSLNDEDEFLEPFMLNDDKWIDQKIVLKIQEGIKAQKKETAEVLNMFFNLGMKTTDIAECVNMSHSNVRQTIRRFRIIWEDENIF